MDRKILFRTLLLPLLISMFALPSLAANVEVKLDSSDGSSALVVKDKNLNQVATIDSNGRVAMGIRTKATGADGAVALGYQTFAGGGHSIAMGHDTRTTAFNTVAAGYQSTAEGSESVAMGKWVAASGPSCVAMGWNTRATANCDTAFGSSTWATGGYSTALGGRTTAAAGNSVAMGDNFTNSTPYSLGIGKGNASSDPPDILMNPNGNCYLNPRASGNVGIGTSEPQAKLHVIGVLKAGDVTCETVRAGWLTALANKAIQATSLSFSGGPTGDFAIGGATWGNVDAVRGSNIVGGTGVGVRGNSDNGTGVWGESPNGTGVYGKSSNGTDVYAYGVYGYASAGPGIRGFSSGNHGIYGTSWGSGKAGVYGETISGYGNQAGVYGNSTDWIGVYGNSGTSTGVAGLSTSGYGGDFRSTSGPGLYASGYPAGRFIGSIEVTSSKGIMLDGQNAPMITRGYDTFTSGSNAGVGRWGLFMEANNLVIGIPDETVGLRGFEIAEYDAAGNRSFLLKAHNGTNNVEIPNHVSVGNSDSLFKVKTFDSVAITSNDQTIGNIGTSKKVFLLETVISAAGNWIPAYAYWASFSLNIYSLYTQSTGAIRVANANGYTVRVIVVYRD